MGSFGSDSAGSGDSSIERGGVSDESDCVGEMRPEERDRREGGPSEDSPRLPSGVGSREEEERAVGKFGGRNPSARDGRLCASNHYQS